MLDLVLYYYADVRSSIVTMQSPLFFLGLYIIRGDAVVTVGEIDEVRARLVQLDSMLLSLFVRLIN